MSLKGKIVSKKAKVGIVGLGYVGLPLAVEIAKAGYQVTGIDVAQGKVDEVNKGVNYISDVDSQELKKLVDEKKLLATTDFSFIKDLDIISICVPTPLSKTKEPDISYLVESARQIAKYLRKNQLIVLESTTYPGTTEEVIRPILEETGLKGERDFYLAYSPERVDPGNKEYAIKNTPKVVGGIGQSSLDLMQLFYSQFIDKVFPVSSTQAAEMSKLLENIFRCVNIALVNELMLLCDRMGINIWEIIEAASTKPFGYMRFLPGPGLGGHCIPIDPFYLSWKARQFDFQTEFIELAGKTNVNMPYYVVSKVFDALNTRHKSIKGAKILILGVAYKKDVDDVRESPALKVIELLLDKGAEVSYHDPFVKEITVAGKRYQSLPLEDSLFSQSDCVVIVTDHSLVDYSAVVDQSNLVVDTRNVLAGFDGENIVRI